MPKSLRFSLSSIFVVTAIVAGFLGGVAYFRLQEESYTFQRKGSSVILQGEFSVTGIYLDSSLNPRRRPFRHTDATLIEFHEAYILVGRGKNAGRYVPRDQLIEFEWSPAPTSASPPAVATAIESDTNAP